MGDTPGLRYRWRTYHGFHPPVANGQRQNYFSGTAALLTAEGEAAAADAAFAAFTSFGLFTITVTIPAAARASPI